MLLYVVFGLTRADNLSQDNGSGTAQIAFLWIFIKDHQIAFEANSMEAFFSWFRNNLEKIIKNSI